MEEIMAMNWKCYDCNMTFTNPSLLQKHKTRFCVGGGIGDPDRLLLRKGFNSHTPRDDTDPVETTDHPRYNPQSDPKVKQLAENHGRSMEALHNRNRDLERQREEIRRRLEDLGRRPIKDDDSMNALLQELRDQDARNKRLLEELRRQLMDVRYIPPPAAPLAPAPAPAPVQTERGRSLVYPIFYGNSLVAEIAAVRQAYIQNGGTDPEILQQLAQMQAEAQAIDDSLKTRPAPKQKDTRPTDQFMILELENERLQRQLLLLQDQNVQARDRRKDNREGRHRLARVMTSHKRDAATVPPLDLSNKGWERHRVRQHGGLGRRFNQVALRSTWTTVPNPLKEQIDKDLANRYGYVTLSNMRSLQNQTFQERYTNITETEPFANNVFKERSDIKDENEQETKIKSDLGVNAQQPNPKVKSDLNGRGKKIKTKSDIGLHEKKTNPKVKSEAKNQPQNPPDGKNNVEETFNDKSKQEVPTLLHYEKPKERTQPMPHPFRTVPSDDLPYYKIHMASSKLNRIENDLRDNYSRLSQPNVRGEDIETWDRVRAMNNGDPSLKPYDRRTEFEAEFFKDTGRHENVAGLTNPSRPQLIVEDTEAK